MPIPTPNQNEKQEDFISRCMSNDTMKEEYDQKQRSAICYDSWRKSGSNGERGGDRGGSQDRQLNPDKSNSKMMTKDCINFISKHYEVEKEEGNKERYIEVPISGLKEDRDGEKMSEQAINKMIDGLKGGVMLHTDHGDGGHNYSWKNITGVSVDGWKEDNLLIAKFRLNKAHPDHTLLWNYVHFEKMPVGFSIGAKPLKSHYEDIEEKNE